MTNSVNANPNRSRADRASTKSARSFRAWVWPTSSSPSYGGSCRPVSVAPTTSPFPQPAAANHWTDNGSSGLCYWMGLESVFAPQDRRVLVADMRSAGGPDIGINIKPLAQANALLLDNLIIPGIRFFGWGIRWPVLDLPVDVSGSLLTPGRVGCHRHHRPTVHRVSQHPPPLRVGVGVRRDPVAVGGDAGGCGRPLRRRGCLAAPTPGGPAARGNFLAEESRWA